MTLVAPQSQVFSVSREYSGTIGPFCQGQTVLLEVIATDQMLNSQVVSAGQVVKGEKPVFGRMWQTPFADRVRQEAGIPTMAVGAITDADQANSILAAGRADLVAVGRPHLANPAWTLNEAARLGYDGAVWPVQYLSGKSQLERLVVRAKAEATAAGTAPQPSKPGELT